MELRVLNRSCGECTACCKTHSVREVGQVAGTWCKHRIATMGCEIYEGRPLACELYQCFWLMGKGEESDRPDRLKIVMDGMSFEVGDRRIDVIGFHEIEVGATKQPRIKQLAAAVKEQGFGVCYHLLLPNGKYTSEYSVRKDLMNPAEFELFWQVVRNRMGPQ